MNKDSFQGQWREIKGKVKEKWGRLTDDDLTAIDGKREQLVGAIQKKYGTEKARIEEDLRKFEKQFGSKKAQSFREDNNVSEDVDFKPESDKRKTGTDNF